jgi:deoxyadenosine/deoxycytidine kinase
MNKKVVNIDGNIGAGKSTLIKKLTNAIHSKDKNLSTIVIEENVDRDASTKALLKNYYQKPKKYAIEFQFWILKDKVKQL